MRDEDSRLDQPPSEADEQPAADAAPGLNRRTVLTSALGVGLTAWAGVVAKNLSVTGVRPALLLEDATYLSEVLACTVHQCAGLRGSCTGLGQPPWGSCSQNAGWGCSQDIGGDCGDFITECNHHFCNDHSCTYHACEEFSCQELHCFVDQCDEQFGDCTPFSGSCTANTAPTDDCSTACDPNSPPTNCTNAHEVETPTGGIASLHHHHTLRETTELETFTRIAHMLGVKTLG